MFPEEDINHGLMGSQGCPDLHRVITTKQNHKFHTTIYCFAVYWKFVRRKLLHFKTSFELTHEYQHTTVIIKCLPLLVRYNDISRTYIVIFYLVRGNC